MQEKRYREWSSFQSLLICPCEACLGITRSRPLDSDQCLSTFRITTTRQLDHVIIDYGGLQKYIEALEQSFERSD
jgi:hypothetical protein